MSTSGTEDSAGTEGTRRVLVINAGSSSLKYQLVDPDTGRADATGLVERIGLPDGRVRHTCGSGTHEQQTRVPDHTTAMNLLRDAFAEHGPDLDAVDLVAVGHRVVHGGASFSEPTMIDDAVLEAVRRLIPLAPLHNPGNLEGIQVAQRVFSDVPQVAVFDTAFHQTMPPEASTYAVPRSWRTVHKVRRYGFHGTSHAYVAGRVADLLGRPLEEVATIVLHLGNGASATAVDGGRSVATSMGLTPLEGLVMGTRPGDLDPGLAGHLVQSAGLSVEEYDQAISNESGLLGLTGSADMREVMARRAAGDGDATLAFDVFTHRLLHYVGGYAAVLGRVDAIAFTAGIGENTPDVRAAVLERLAGFGVVLDAEANASARGETLITTPDSSVAAFVVPTNEEWEIARQAAQVVARRADPELRADMGSINPGDRLGLRHHQLRRRRAALRRFPAQAGRRAGESVAPAPSGWRSPAPDGTVRHDLAVDGSALRRAPPGSADHCLA